MFQLFIWSEYKSDMPMLKALGMRMWKLVLGLPVAQILPEKINKMLSLDNLGFIDVLATVASFLVVYKDPTFEFWQKSYIIL